MKWIVAHLDGEDLTGFEMMWDRRVKWEPKAGMAITDPEPLEAIAERISVIQRSDVFGAMANCDDKTLDTVLEQIAGKKKRHKR